MSCHYWEVTVAGRWGVDPIYVYISIYIRKVFNSLPMKREHFFQEEKDRFSNHRCVFGPTISTTRSPRQFRETNRLQQLPEDFGLEVWNHILGKPNPGSPSKKPSILHLWFDNKTMCFCPCNSLSMKKSWLQNSLETFDHRSTSHDISRWNDQGVSRGSTFWTDDFFPPESVREFWNWMSFCLVGLFLLYFQKKRIVGLEEQKATSYLKN